MKRKCACAPMRPKNLLCEVGPELEATVAKIFLIYLIVKFAKWNFDYSWFYFYFYKKWHFLKLKINFFAIFHKHSLYDVLIQKFQLKNINGSYMLIQASYQCHSYPVKNSYSYYLQVFSLCFCLIILASISYFFQFLTLHTLSHD